MWNFFRETLALFRMSILYSCHNPFMNFYRYLHIGSSALMTSSVVPNTYNGHSPQVWGSQPLSKSNSDLISTIDLWDLNVTCTSANQAFHHACIGVKQTILLTSVRINTVASWGLSHLPNQLYITIWSLSPLRFSETSTLLL